MLNLLFIGFHFNIFFIFFIEHINFSSSPNLFLEKVYFNANNKKYLEFYDNIFKYGILDYQNLELYLED